MESQSFTILGFVLDKKELGEWWHITWTAGLSATLRSALPFIDVAFLGHFGTSSLSAASLANIWLQMTSMWLIAGQEEVISTLVSQAWGHKNQRLAGAWLQIAIIVMSVLCVPITITWVFGSSILHGLNLGSWQLTDQAQLFMRWYALSLLPQGIFSAVSAWLNAQGSTYPAIATSTVALVVSVGANYLLIFGDGSWSGLGFIGSPISTGIVNIVAAAAILLITACGRYGKETRVFTLQWDLIADRGNLGNFIEQAIPNYIGMILEILQLQLLAGIAAHIGEIPLAVQNVNASLFMICISLMMGAVRGTSVRVGHCLGADRIDLAKQTMYVAFVGMGVLGVVLAALMLGLKDQLPSLFSTDPAVTSLATSLLPLVAGAVLIFSVEFAAMGVLFGQGRPGPVTLAAMAGNWCVCIPMAFTLAKYTSLGIHAIWYSLIAGYGVCTLITVVLLWRTNWEQCRDDAIKRSSAGEDAKGASAQKGLLDSGDSKTASLLEA